MFARGDAIIRRMTPAMRHILAFFLNYGVFGLLLLTIADDSFLFLPVGGDLLMVILVVHNHGGLPIYVAAGAAGSTIGVFLLDLVCRKGGEEGLKRVVKPRLHNYLKGKMERHAGVAVVIVCAGSAAFSIRGGYRGGERASVSESAAVDCGIFGPRGAVFCWWVGRQSNSGAEYSASRDSPEFMWFMGGFIAMCLDRKRL